MFYIREWRAWAPQINCQVTGRPLDPKLSSRIAPRAPDMVRTARSAYASCRRSSILPGRAPARMAAEVTVMQPKMVVGVFDDHADAVGALQELKDAGFDPDQVSVAMLQTPRPEVEERHTHHVDETTGILAGGALGGLAGWLIGATAVAVPGLGALLAAGALVGAVGGAGIGAAAGGLIGHLIDQGLSQDEAELLSRARPARRHAHDRPRRSQPRRRGPHDHASTRRPRLPHPPDLVERPTSESDHHR